MIPVRNHLSNLAKLSKLSNPMFLFVALIALAGVACQPALIMREGFSTTTANLPSLVTVTPTPSSGAPTPTPSVQGKNMIPVSIGNCGPNSYPNQICASVTICVPGTSQCQTIDNMLVDTGSAGVRIFGSLISIPLPAVNDSQGRALVQCAAFMIGSSWGPVKTADVKLGSSDPARVPIQVIDASTPGLPSYCTNPDQSPAQAGFNGILGVGLFADDCGPACVNDPNNRAYHYCAGASCTGTTMASANQVTNPVSKLLSDNNGIVLQVAALPTHEAVSASGQLYLGVGTQTNNTLSGLTVLTSDADGYITTSYNGQTYPQSFIDSGSNILFFEGPSSLPRCQAGTSVEGFYCPTSPTAWNVQLTGRNSITASLSFLIANALTFLNSSFNVSDQLGAETVGHVSLGMPFFFGKSVVIQMEGRTSALGSGPLYAF